MIPDRTFGAFIAAALVTAACLNELYRLLMRGALPRRVVRK